MQISNNAIPSARPAVMTIAGSDSGGGAGIQADLQTFAAAGVFGTSAITCLTAQNPDAVTAIRSVDPEMVSAQIAAVWNAFRVRGVKTGMLYSAAIIEAVAEGMAERRPPVLVVDPVMVAGSGARLLQPDAVQALQDRLLPLAGVVTPNIAEAEILAQTAIADLAAQQRAAAAIARRWGVACIVKGGHLDSGDQVNNVVVWQDRVQVLPSPRLQGAKTHGTGCTFAAAVTAAMVCGADVMAAAAWAADAVAAALKQRPLVGAYQPLNWRAIPEFRSTGELA